MQARMIFLHAYSPLHVGTGQGVGVIDLPVAREKGTGIPILPGSSLKGVLRSQVEDETLRKKVFGPDTTAAHEHAGSVQFGDLHLLFLPVRSLRGTFAWVTSPFLLHRVRRDLQWVRDNLNMEIPQVEAENTCLVNEETALIFEHGEEEKVILEDLDIIAQKNASLNLLSEKFASWIFPDETWQKLFRARICVVHDDVMRFFLDTALEVTARIRLDEATKTVQKGALWYEEALPAETIMAGLMLISPVKAREEDVIKAVQQAVEKPLQIGGNATVGRGLCRLHLVEGLA